MTLHLTLNGAWGDVFTLGRYWFFVLKMDIFVFQLPKCTQTSMQTPISTYLQSVQSLCPKVTAAELAYLVQGLTVTEHKPKDFYIHAQRVQNEIGFVYVGLLRAFYIDNQGNEITVNFIRENHYATHYLTHTA